MAEWPKGIALLQQSTVCDDVEVVLATLPALNRMTQLCKTVILDVGKEICRLCLKLYHGT